MAHNTGWGTRAGGYTGDQRRNPFAVIPYVLFAGIVTAGTLLTT